MDEKLKKMKKEVGDLSDIVLGKESKRSHSTKKWILTIASALILFLIILLIMKMLNQPDVDTAGSDNIASVGENIETVNKDKELVTTEDSEGEQDNLFKKEPIIDESSNTDLKFEEMVKKLKEQDIIEETPTAVQPKKEVVTDVVKKVQETTKEIKKEVPVVTTTTQTPTQTFVETIEPSAQIVQKEINKPVKKVVHNKIKHTVKRSPSKSFEQVNIPSVSGYFIQVGATTASFPNRKFLQKIKNAGFDYIVHSTYIKGRKIKKVLVGPYHSRDGAKSVLPKVKANINPSAYIYRLK